MKFLKIVTAALLANLAVSGAAHAKIEVSYEGEKPGVQNTTAQFSFSAVETFDTIPTGSSATEITQTFVDSAHPATSITMGFTGANGIQINPADQYGGAGGTGNYAVSFIPKPVTLNLSSTNLSKGVNYFGFWLSALDPGNEAQFYDGNGKLLFDFNPQDVLNVVTRDLNAGEYYGNPNPTFQGQDSGEPYIFLNFFNTGGTFSKIVFQEAPNYGGGYETDNYTVGHYTGFGQGTFVPTPLSSPTPETTTWAMLMIGVGAIGGTLRMRGSVRGQRRAIAAFA